MFLIIFLTFGLKKNVDATTDKVTPRDVTPIHQQMESSQL